MIDHEKTIAFDIKWNFISHPTLTSLNSSVNDVHKMIIKHIFWIWPSRSMHRRGFELVFVLGVYRTACVITTPPVVDVIMTTQVQDRTVVSVGRKILKHSSVSLVEFCDRCEKNSEIRRPKWPSYRRARNTPIDGLRAPAASVSRQSAAEVKVAWRASRTLSPKRDRAKIHDRRITR